MNSDERLAHLDETDAPSLFEIIGRNVILHTLFISVMTVIGAFIGVCVASLYSSLAGAADPKIAAIPQIHVISTGIFLFAPAIFLSALFLSANLLSRRIPLSVSLKIMRRSAYAISVSVLLAVPLLFVLPIRPILFFAALMLGLIASFWALSTVKKN